MTEIPEGIVKRTALQIAGEFLENVSEGIRGEILGEIPGPIAGEISRNNA